MLNNVFNFTVWHAAATQESSTHLKTNDAAKSESFEVVSATIGKHDTQFFIDPNLTWGDTKNIH